MLPIRFNKITVVIVFVFSSAKTDISTFQKYLFIIIYELVQVRKIKNKTHFY